MKKIITTIAAITTVTALSGAVFAATATVNTDELNLREKASTESETLNGLVKGDKLNIISEEGDWYEVTFNGQRGYVSKQYVNKDEEVNSTGQDTTNTTENVTVSNPTNEISNTETTTTSQTVDIASVNRTTLKEIATLYVLPLMNSTSLGFVDANTNVLLISVNGKWAYIQTDKQSGWVLSSKLASTAITLLGTVNNAGNISSTTTNNNTTENEPNQTETKTTSKIMYVKGDLVNVREEANTSSNVVTTITQNTEVTVIVKEGEWYKVETSSGNGYIREEFLTDSKQEN